jgi:transcriptional regulator with XRE-family HTH domain
VTARTGPPSPTLRGRRLGAELRRLREQAGRTIQDVAKTLECSDSKVSRIETGQVSATARDVGDMLDLYRVGHEQREALIRVAREVRQRGWWSNYADVSDGMPAYASLEVAAGSILTYMALVLPALFQTEAYAEAVLRAILPNLLPEEIERRVQLRMDRQSILKQGDPPNIWVVLDEASLRRPVGSNEIMRTQLDKLLEAATSPTVTLQVLPTGVGEHAGLDGPFTIVRYSEPAEPDFVVLDSVMRELYLEDADELERYIRVFDRLRTASLAPDDSARFIRDLGAELYPEPSPRT